MAARAPFPVARLEAAAPKVAAEASRADPPAAAAPRAVAATFRVSGPGGGGGCVDNVGCVSIP
ncbi:hypothetical protein S7W_08153 [Mycobacteroides abscessus M94]|nr:hypothetical protein S7W_08153 [Mycobacteroides abscessus M94]